MTRGSAWFIYATAKSPSGPLTTAGSGLFGANAEGTLTALGTAFTVRQFAGGTRLAVQQHAEVVLPSGSAQRVNAGESLWFTRDRFAALVKLNGGEDSWIRGVLTFHDAPLSEVVETLARYRSGVLRCDPAVADYA